MKVLATILLACAALLTTASSSFAHDGHGHTASDGHTLVHHFTEPVHFIPLTLAAVLVSAIVFGWLRFRSLRLTPAKATFERR